MRFLSRAGAAVLASLSLAACNREGDGASAAPANTDAIARHVAAPPWLRDRLPADTIAYARIPSPWGGLAAPNGKAADSMFASQAHVDAIAALRGGFGSNPVLAPERSEIIAPPFRWGSSPTHGIQPS